MTNEELRKKIGCDSVSKSKGIYTAREAFYYRLGRSAEWLEGEVKKAFPDAAIIDSGERFVPFRGGDSLAKGSHWWVKFTL